MNQSQAEIKFKEAKLAVYGLIKLARKKNLTPAEVDYVERMENWLNNNNNIKDCLR